ncbi:DMT family transporter [Jeotgalibacillus malaysiensis]|uniref:DMT family transporter n=1 Tax=Jeotgalibacillus malaysiensis TaxID=1508404 RepID=UPI00384AD40D
MKKGFLLLIIATLFWAGNYIAGRYLSDALPPTLLNTVRWAISSLLLWGLLVINKKPFPIFSRWKEFLILGFFGIFIFSTTTYMGLREISSSQAGMIVAGIPVSILIFSFILLKEKIKVKSWIGTVISIIGVVILIQGKENIESFGNALAGEVLIIISCIAWGLYTVLGRKYGKATDPLTLTAGAAVYGTILSLISCIGTVDMNAVQMDGMAWLALFYVSTFASVAAYLAWNAGVKILGPGTAAPFINLLPIWTVILGVIVLNEGINTITLVGGVIAIIGAILASLKK